MPARLSVAPRSIGARGHADARRRSVACSTRSSVIADSKSSSESKRLVDAREPQVGDLVELAQRRQDRQTDVVRLDLRDAGGADRSPRPAARARARSASVTGRPWQALRTPDTIFSRLNGSTTPLRLMTLRLAVSVVREAAAALGALPPAADREPVVARARVDDAAVGVAAERAEHGALRLRRLTRRREARSRPGTRGVDGVAVRGQLPPASLSAPDAGARPSARAAAVVADDLLRPQERRRAETRPRTAPGRRSAARGWSRRGSRRGSPASTAPRKIAPAFSMRSSTAPGSAVCSSRCSGP